MQMRLEKTAGESGEKLGKPLRVTSNKRNITTSLIFELLSFRYMENNI